MFTANGADRSANAVASESTRPTAPPSWKMSVYDQGCGAARLCSTSASIAPSSSPRRKCDFQ